jgi:peroxiredoxin (alkyl hydroperoxide reductase subunit C)
MENINETKMPLIGDPLPQMKVVTTHGVKSLPDDYAGKWLVLFSHPADFTPVCTTEFVAFAKRVDQFKELNCELLGLSIDQVFAHIKWGEWIEENLGVEITFPIIADDGTVGKRLGMIHPNQGSNTVRAVFIIDPKGVIRAILYYPQELGRNMEEIVRMVKGLQVVDKNKVSLPANWPNNELIKDHVIVPPPRDVKAAKERLQSKEFECYDWWLCHKKL